MYKLRLDKGQSSDSGDHAGEENIVNSERGMVAGSCNFCVLRNDLDTSNTLHLGERKLATQCNR